MNEVPAVQAKGRYRASGPGYTITAAAREIPMPRKRLQRAVDLGEVEFVEFGGLKLLTPATIVRIRQLYGIEPQRK